MPYFLMAMAINYIVDIDGIHQQLTTNYACLVLHKVTTSLITFMHVVYYVNALA